MQQSSEKQRRKELGEFLRTRRRNLSSQQIGMPPGRHRRTPGLRREEVAIAAGMSTTWYTALEQGRDIQVSSSILSSLANVLRLTEDERIYLYTLAKQPLPLGISPEEALLPIYQHMLDEFGTLPALLTGHTFAILGWNSAAKMIFGDFGNLPENERNLLWLLFVDTPWNSQMTFFVEREQCAQEALETFRSLVSRYLDDPEIVALIERLQQASPVFKRLWPEHNVRSTWRGRRHLRHPLVGDLTFETTTFQMIEHPTIRCHLFSGDKETSGKLNHLLKANDMP